MRTVVYFLVLLFGSASGIDAQTIDASDIIRKSNERILAIQQGAYHIKRMQQSPMSEESDEYQGDIRFARANGDNRAWAAFEFDAGQRKRVYAGNQMYVIHGATRKIHISRMSGDSVAEELKGNAVLNLLLEPSMTSNTDPGFYPSMFTNCLIDTLTTATGRSLKLTSIDSMQNRYRITDKDRAMAVRHIELYLSLPDLLPERQLSIVHMFDRPFVTDIQISAFQQLPAGYNIAGQAYVDSLLANGYTLEELLKPNQTTEEAPQKPVAMPHFELTDVDGNTVQSKQLGARYLLLDFWYVSCFPCLKAAPVIDSVYHAYKNKGLAVYGVDSIDKDVKKVKDIMSRRNITYPTLMDPDKTLNKALKVKGYPTLLLVDLSNNNIVYFHSGYSPELKATLEKLLNEKLR